MPMLAEPISRLVEEFSRLPGIGPKTASRLTYYLLRAPDERVASLAEAIRQLKERLVYCQVCQNIAEASPCSICANERRDHAVICVVEEPLDVLAIERTARYNGVYHVLHGAISPVEGIGPDDIRVNELMRRLADSPVREVLLATNPSLEGEATAMYLVRLIGAVHPMPRLTRLATGLPIGGDLEYADEITLGRALDGRREL
jgi:recombination protein RecR